MPNTRHRRYHRTESKLSELSLRGGEAAMDSQKTIDWSYYRLSDIQENGIVFAHTRHPRHLWRQLLLVLRNSCA